MKSLNVTILLSLLGAAAPAFADTPSIPVTLENKNDWVLGSGYDTQKQTIMGFCVDNSPDSGPPPEPTVEEITGSLNLSLQRDQQQVADKLGVSGSGRYQTGVTTTSLSADFYQDSSASSYRTSYTYLKEDLFRESLVSSRAYPIRPLPQRMNAIKLKEKWSDACGDQFVQSRIKGARLFINVSVSFVSKAEKDHFNTKFGLSTPVVDIAAELDKNHEEFSSANRMTVQALQVGGDTSKLGYLLCPKTADGTTPDPECVKSSRAVVDCAFGNMGECTSMIANAMAYANGRDVGQFPSQIEDRKDFVVTELETAPYTSVGDPFPPPMNAQDRETREAARTNALDLFGRVYKKYVFADQLWSGQAPRLSDREKNEMLKIRTEIRRMLEDVTDLVDTCYDDSAKACNGKYASLEAKDGFKQGNWETALNDRILALIAPETFSQYCDVADADHPAVSTTVRTLWAYAKKNMSAEEFTAIDTKGDRCANMDEWLSKVTDLTIEPAADPLKPTIADLGPITALKGLVKLNLAGQSIRDLRPLVGTSDVPGLTGLQELTLDGNQIEDVSPLAALKKLKTLSVENNQLASVGALGALDGQLTLLDAEGNRNDLTCPLKNPASCRLMSFADYAEPVSGSTKCGYSTHAAAVAVSDNQVLAVGGLDLFDPSAKMQLVSNEGCRPLLKDLATPRLGQAMTMTPNGILVIGGGTNKIEIIDPHTYVPRPFPSALIEPVTNHTATLLSGGRVLVVGGATDANPVTAMTQPQSISRLVQIVNPDGTIKVLKPLSSPRTGHTATLLANGNVLIAGGYSLNQMLATAEIINPDADEHWTAKGSMPFGRMGQGAALLPNGHVLLVGGKTWDIVDSTPGDGAKSKETQVIGQTLDFDPSTETFLPIDARLGEPVSNPQMITTSDQRVLVIGGTKNSVKDDSTNQWVRQASSLIQVYDPTTMAFYQIKPTMLNARLGFTATALDDTHVLIFGGAAAMTYDSSAHKTTAVPLQSATELLVYRPRN